MTTNNPARILVIGAHPDDADIKVGGTAAKWRKVGAVVKFVSITDGSAGHHLLRGTELSRRRRGEASAAAAVIGASYDVLDYPDGELMATVEARRDVIRLIRNFRPDLVITHRASDYHPDHHYTAQLVQDAAYMVTVPAICPETPILKENPIILHMSDFFKRPYPFEPHIVVDIGNEFETLVRMLDCHESQFYEWLPSNGGFAHEVPAELSSRKEWLADRIARRIRPLADLFRAQVVNTYGPERGSSVEFIEAFEISELGSPLDAETKARFFPFLPRADGSPLSKPRREWVDMPGG